MSLPDATAIAALQDEVIKPVWYVRLDFLGDPVLCNTSGANVTPAGTGEADLDGALYVGISGEFATVSAVKFAPGGSESVTATLSGIPGVDDDTLAILTDPANWRGRNARIWRVIRNAANVQQGGFHNYYTGKMVGAKLGGSSGDQTITITIESYLSVFSQASNRTYMDQTRFDAGDESAAAAIAIANGNFTGAVATPSTAGIDYSGINYWGGF